MTTQAPETREAVAENRQQFLAALRSGEYVKGPIETDDRGRPLDPAATGWCAVGLAHTLFVDDDLPGSHAKMCAALGLTTVQLRKIQQEWNDTDLTFPEIADLIESEML